MNVKITMNDGEVTKAVREYLVRNGVSEEMARDVVVQIDTHGQGQRDTWVDIDGDRWRIRAATKGTR